MGQYWRAVNVDKCEVIHGGALGGGIKLMEHVGSWPGTGAGLVVLLADCPDPRGGGDPSSAEVDGERVFGRWAGDRVVLIGDYAENTDGPPLGGFPRGELYDASQNFRDVSDLVARALARELGGHFSGGEHYRSFYYGSPTPAPTCG